MGPRRPNITSIKKRRRHRDKAAEGKKEDATPDLLLKHQKVTFAIYVRNS
jgi:hypothetical protein